MEFVSTIIAGILSLYLSGVQGIAHIIQPSAEAETIPITTPVEDNTESVESTGTVAENTDTIPHILLENAAYQKAAVVESIAPEEATSTAYDALVNIYCEHREGQRIKVTTGTGFFIDTDGVILTNAHVAHFLLMDDIIGETSCVIRTGNPAEAKYTADLLYISPAWVRENAEVFASKNPTGTGERDYALLYINGTVDNRPLPRAFPALPFDVELMKNSVVGDAVYAAGYPAQALFESGGKAPLVPKLATTSIAELMTFGSNRADVFTITGTEVGEHGASGGPVLTPNGDVIGVISTKGDATQFGEGALRAITLSYVDRTITEETGFSLRQNLAGDIPFRANIFNETMSPFLRLVLDQAL